jgi:serine/threonine protein kinase
MTAHLSDSAIDLIRRLLHWDPQQRITASDMLEHPWVRGETARKDKISGSDKKLSHFRVFKSRLEAKVFEDIVSWAEASDTDDASKRASLIERSFRKLDEEQKGMFERCWVWASFSIFSHYQYSGNIGISKRVCNR